MANIQSEILDTIGNNTVTWSEIKSSVDATDDIIKRTVQKLLNNQEIKADKHFGKEWNFYKPDEENRECENCGIMVNIERVVKKPVAGQHWGHMECRNCGEGLGTYTIGEIEMEFGL